MSISSCSGGVVVALSLLVPLSVRCVDDIVGIVVLPVNETAKRPGRLKPETSVLRRGCRLAMPKPYW